MWPTLAACSEEVQWGILKSWVGRRYELPLTLTPCDMWRHLAGRTLFLAGDSIMQAGAAAAWVARGRAQRAALHADAPLLW